MNDFIDNQKKVSNIKLTSSILSTDILLYSKPFSETDQTYYKDCVVNDEQLAENIKDGVLEKLNLKSMAYEDKYAYSPVRHIHDYSKVYIDSFNTYGLTKDVKKEETGELSILARIEINGQKTNINALGAFNPDPPVVDIGTLMFVAYKTLSSIDTNSPDFDGYVYPDGRSLKKEDFPDAYQCFGDTYKLTSDPDDEFRIPILSDFICLNPMTTTTECCKRNNFQNGIKAHTHEWQLSMEGKTQPMKIDVGVGGANWNDGGIHQGDLTSKQMPDHITNAQVRLSSDNLYLNNDFDAETNEQHITEVESTPNYMLLPVLIYIGENQNVEDEEDSITTTSLSSKKNKSIITAVSPLQLSIDNDINNKDKDMNNNYSNYISSESTYFDVYKIESNVRFIVQDTMFTKLSGYYTATAQSGDLITSYGKMFINGNLYKYNKSIENYNYLKIYETSNGGTKGGVEDITNYTKQFIYKNDVINVGYQLSLEQAYKTGKPYIFKQVEFPSVSYGYDTDNIKFFEIYLTSFIDFNSKSPMDKYVSVPNTLSDFITSFTVHTTQPQNDSLQIMLYGKFKNVNKYQYNIKIHRTLQSVYDPFANVQSGADMYAYIPLSNMQESNNTYLMAKRVVKYDTIKSMGINFWTSNDVLKICVSRLKILEDVDFPDSNYF